MGIDALGGRLACRDYQQLSVPTVSFVAKEFTVTSVINFSPHLLSCDAIFNFQQLIEKRIVLLILQKIDTLRIIEYVIHTYIHTYIHTHTLT